ncbi:MAG: hypothetical protein AB7T06_42955 [Kofleriaceae bacterium]
MRQTRRGEWRAVQAEYSKLRAAALARIRARLEQLVRSAKPGALSD